MPDLKDGETAEVKGSASKPYVLKNVGGVYSCSCPAWRNQSVPIEKRTCKHLRAYRGEEAEQARLGSAVPPPRKPAGAEKTEGPPLLQAERWVEGVNPAGWWLSEKLDGVRAYWDGKNFISRYGNLFLVPDWFLTGLPSVPLDGELWIGRKQFQKTSGIVRRGDRSELWREVRYVVFDAPGMTAPFEERIAFITDFLRQAKLPHALPHEHQQCRGRDHLHEELARVEAVGGEGLMLRQPGSRYEAGRSGTLLKVKSFLDAEARVLEYQPGKGRHKGRVGALVVELADGTRFAVGTGLSDADREKPPPIGSIIGFRYQELSDGGVPRFPSYLGVREGVELAPPPEMVSPPSPTPAPAPAAPSRAAASPPTPPAAAPRAGGVRHFEFVEGNSQKFWEVSVNGNEMTTRWGRLGSAGQSKTKAFMDEAAAQAQADKLIADKTSEGYVEK